MAARKFAVGPDDVDSIRNPVSQITTTHILELAPEDLKLLALHSGWKVVYDQIYRQYPKYGLMRIMKPWWERFDFEGFYGMILTRDDSWSSLYKDW